MIKKGGVKLAAHVARFGGRGEEKRMQGFGGGNLKERNYMEDLDIDGRILNWIVKKQDGSA